MSGPAGTVEPTESITGVRARYPRAMTAIRRWLATGALVSAGFVGGVLLTGRLQSHEPDTAPAAADAAAPAAAGQAAGPIATVSLPDFTQIAARTSPAVVNISAVQVIRQRRFPDPFFGGMFGDDEQFATQRGQSAGSGVIINSDGYVLTNNHVLGQGTLQQVTVILSDRRERPAKLIGIDPQTDLALLKINEKNLPAVAWGDSSNLKVAEWVLAVGNPYQLGQTVTLGVVSALNRTYDDVSTLVDYIQTDAAINRGNSGGALINRRGELVGINTWIVSEGGGGSVGLGFAIPSNIARRVADEIIRTGTVRRGTIGDIRLASVTPELARDLSLPDTKGAVVWSLYRTSSAYRAGLRPGDTITSASRQAGRDAGAVPARAARDADRPGHHHRHRPRRHAARNQGAGRGAGGAAARRGRVDAQRGQARTAPSRRRSDAGRALAAVGQAAAEEQRAGRRRVVVRRDRREAGGAVHRDGRAHRRQGIEADLAVAETGRLGDHGVHQRPAQPEPARPRIDVEALHLTDGPGERPQADAADRRASTVASQQQRPAGRTVLPRQRRQLGGEVLVAEIDRQGRCVGLEQRVNGREVGGGGGRGDAERALRRRGVRHGAARSRVAGTGHRRMPGDRSTATACRRRRGCRSAAPTRVVPAGRVLPRSTAARRRTNRRRSRAA